MAESSPTGWDVSKAFIKGWLNKPTTRKVAVGAGVGGYILGKRRAKNHKVYIDLDRELDRDRGNYEYSSKDFYKDKILSGLSNKAALVGKGLRKLPAATGRALLGGAKNASKGALMAIGAAVVGDIIRKINRHVPYHPDVKIDTEGHNRYQSFKHAVEYIITFGNKENLLELYSAIAAMNSEAQDAGLQYSLDLVEREIQYRAHPHNSVQYGLLDNAVKTVSNNIKGIARAGWGITGIPAGIQGARTAVRHPKVAIPALAAAAIPAAIVARRKSEEQYMLPLVRAGLKALHVASKTADAVRLPVMGIQAGQAISSMRKAKKQESEQLPSEYGFVGKSAKVSAIVGGAALGKAAYDKLKDKNKKKVKEYALSDENKDIAKSLLNAVRSSSGAERMQNWRSLVGHVRKTSTAIPKVSASKLGKVGHALTMIKAPHLRKDSSGWRETVQHIADEHAAQLESVAKLKGADPKFAKNLGEKHRQMLSEGVSKAIKQGTASQNKVLEKALGTAKKDFEERLGEFTSNSGGAYKPNIAHSTAMSDVPTTSTSSASFTHVPTSIGSSSSRMLETGVKPTLSKEAKTALGVGGAATATGFPVGLSAGKKLGKAEESKRIRKLIEEDKEEK